MGFFCGMTVVLILVSFCCHLYEFIKAEDWQHSLRDLVLCNLKREVPTSVVFTGLRGSVADPDPGPGAFLTLDPDPGYGIGFFSGSRIADLGSRIPNPYFESLVTNFG
jgi:hypothetical protein